MKPLLTQSVHVLALATCFVLSHAAHAATIAVTPSAVSNTYSGFLTLTITDVTNHEPVIVETYFDLNNNSTVDGADLLLDVFRLTESGVSTIGGITNRDVPFDSDSVTSTITATLSFAPPIESTVGQKIYRVVSPFDRFVPATALFNVTNAALNQGVAGTVFSGGVPQPGVIVVALELPDFMFTSAALSDGGGNYFLKLPVGTYAVLPAKPGAYTDQSIVPIAALTNGVMATNNVFLTNGSATVSGRVYDAVSSNGLGGVFIQFESQDYFGVAFSDTNGNYTGGVSSNLWKLKVDSSRMSRRGYVRPQESSAEADTTLGSVTNVNIGLFQGNALFYGRVTNAFGAPLANISVGSHDSGNFLSGEGFTDANGYYSVVALVNTNAFPGSDVWRVAPNNENSLLKNAIVSQSPDVTLTTNQAYLQNFSVLPVTATISGRLQDNLGNGVSGVGMGAYATINGTMYNTSSVDTDNDGNFSIGVANGQWSMWINCCGNNGLDNQGYYDPTPQHDVSIPPTNQVMNITVLPIGTPYLSQPVRFGSSQFNFFLSGQAGSKYTIQATTNLASSNWFTVMVVTNLPGNYFYIQDFNATNGQRFYRALLGP